MDELNIKLGRMRALLAQKNLDALVLTQVSSFAWATCGSPSWVNTAVAAGVASLVVTLDNRYLVTNNVEAPRMEKEELLGAQGWEFIVEPWWEPAAQVGKLTRGLMVGADHTYPGTVNLSGEISRLRAMLTPQEQDRFREVGRACADAVGATMDTIQPGQTEWQVASRLASECERRGIQAIDNMVGSDERLFAYRHIIPKNKVIERYAMLVLCGRKQGLVAALTRLVHFGPMPADLRRKAEAVARVDAAYIAHTRPGKTLDGILAAGIDAYAEAGFLGEWQNHFQGGSCGYEPREVLAVPGLQEKVDVGQVFAWNPSIQGTKSEDSIIVTPAENEVITAIPGWPLVEVGYQGKTYLRPAIREIL
jgi:antitoxin VapB